MDGVSFEFIATGQTCTTLQEAFRRYYRLMFNDNYSGRGTAWSDSNDVVVDSLSVDVTACDDVHPTSSSDESCKYNLVIMFDSGLFYCLLFVENGVLLTETQCVNKADISIL